MNFILGVEMKGMVDWALVLARAQMKEADSVYLPKLKNYLCLWLLFPVEDFSQWC